MSHTKKDKEVKPKAQPERPRPIQAKARALPAAAKTTAPAGQESVTNWYVSGFGEHTTEVELRDAFLQFGKVLEAKIRYDKLTGVSRGFGFVTIFSEHELTEAHLADLSLGEKRLRVRPKVDLNQLKTGRRFFIKGLSPATTDDTLRMVFGKFGQVLDAKIFKDKTTGRPRGLGTVTFVQDATLTASDFDGIEIEGRLPTVETYVEHFPSSGEHADQSALVKSEQGSIAAQGPEDEPSQWIELHDANGDAQAALIRFSAEDSRNILNQLSATDYSDGERTLASRIGDSVVDQLSNASSVVATGLQAGQVFQVVGTPALVEGLKSGTYTMMTTAQGSLGTVTSASTGQIAGQLRFAQASLAPVLAPVVVYQVLHAIAGTSQLKKINKRLDTFQRSLERLNARGEAEILGQVRHSMRKLDDIRVEHETTGMFTRDMELRLALVERDIGSIMERNAVLVETFRGKTHGVFTLRGKQGAVTAATLLNEEGGQALHDMDLFTALMAADLGIQEMRLRLAMEQAPKDAGRRMENIREKVHEYREVIKSLPSLEGVRSHAEECVDEMGWWQRKVLARSVVKDVKSLQARDIAARAAVLPNPDKQLQPSYVFWKDKQGVKHVFMLPEKKAEKESGNG